MTISYLEAVLRRKPSVAGEINKNILDMLRSMRWAKPLERASQALGVDRTEELQGFMRSAEYLEERMACLFKLKAFLPSDSDEKPKSLAELCDSPNYVEMRQFEEMHWMAEMAVDLGKFEEAHELLRCYLEFVGPDYYRQNIQKQSINVREADKPVLETLLSPTRRQNCLWGILLTCIHGVNPERGPPIILDIAENLDSEDSSGKAYLLHWAVALIFEPHLDCLSFMEDLDSYLLNDANFPLIEATNPTLFRYLVVFVILNGTTRVDRLNHFMLTSNLPLRNDPVIGLYLSLWQDFSFDQVLRDLPGMEAVFANDIFLENKYAAFAEQTRYLIFLCSVNLHSMLDINNLNEKYGFDDACVTEFAGRPMANPLVSTEIDWSARKIHIVRKLEQPSENVIAKVIRVSKRCETFVNSIQQSMEQPAL